LLIEEGDLVGKSRSKILARYLKEQDRRHRVRTMSILPPWVCPWCIEHDNDGFISTDERTMVFKYNGRKKQNSSLIMIYCYKCKQGEVMPVIRSLDPIDYYHCVIDHEFDGKIPQFYALPNDKVTLGICYLKPNKEVSSSNVEKI